MSTTPSLFSPLKQAVLAFFKHDLALRRDEGRVRLVLEDRLVEPAKRPLSRAQVAANKESQELAQAREELARVLDQDNKLRAKVRHLAFVEHALEKKGWRGLYKVPLEVLQKALEQLEGLVTNWSPAGLACLRSKMAVAAIDREHNNPEREADAYRTAAVFDSPPMVAAQAIENAKATSIEDEDAALLAAYAAMGVDTPAAEPVVVEMQGELGSRSARDLARSASRAPQTQAADIRLRGELQRP